MLFIIRINDRILSCFKSTNLFYHPSILMSEIWTLYPLFGKVLKIQKFKNWKTPIYKGGQLQLWTRLSISFSHDFQFIRGLNYQLSIFFNKSEIFISIYNLRWQYKIIWLALYWYNVTLVIWSLGLGCGEGYKRNKQMEVNLTSIHSSG